MIKTSLWGMKMCGFISTYELSSNSEGPEDTSKESPPPLTETEGEWSNNMYLHTQNGKEAPGMSYGEFRVERVIPGRAG